MSKDKKNVAVLFGGRSAEHEISVITGLEVVNALDPVRYDVSPVYIDTRGRWFVGEELRNKNFYRGVPACLDQLTEVYLKPTPGTGGLTVVSKGGLKALISKKEEIIRIDVFIPAFHGQIGEDGRIQGLFDMAEVAYTGCGVLASAVAMDKGRCKAMVKSAGIPVLPGVVVKKKSVQKNLAAARERILAAPGLEKFPLFVKPVNLGSSVGVGRAENPRELDACLAKAFQVDTEALVEPCISKLLEINISILESPAGPIASVVEVPVATDKTLTYEDKYMRGGKGSKGKGGSKSSGPQRLQGMAGLSRVINPEDLDEGYRSGVTEYAKQAFECLGCDGLVRFDFMVDLDSGKLYFNELNPLPGSLAFYLWEKSKPKRLYTDFLNQMIDGAIARKNESAVVEWEMGFRAMFA